ncbi:MAG TPA: peptidylprolyl isomerase [Terriglobales bacterium]|nr:peptidylprolyl isomerase [Terriglobales bacterium]
MKLKSLLAICCIFLLSVSLAADTIVEEIIARINDSIITRADLTKSKDEIQNELRQQNIPDTDPRAVEKQKDALRDLIDQQLLLEKGKDLGVTGDTELVKKLDEIRKQLNLASMDDLEKEAQKQGVSFEDFKQGIRNQIITQQVINQEVAPHIQITPEEVQKYYDAHKSELTQPESVDLSEILVSTGENDVNVDPNAPPPPEDAAKVAAAQEKANQLLASLKGGAKFDELAKKSSDGPTAGQGGELGAFKRGTLAKQLEDLTFNMKPGTFSDVIRTKQGFVILRVNEHTAAGVPPLKQVENQIQNAIYYDKLQPALRAYLTKLREDAFIHIAKGYVDTAASPNETEPVFTDQPLTAGKKLKKKKKMGIF